MLASHFLTAIHKRGQFIIPVDCNGLGCFMGGVWNGALTPNKIKSLPNPKETFTGVQINYQLQETEGLQATCIPSPLYRLLHLGHLQHCRLLQQQGHHLCQPHTHLPCCAWLLRNPASFEERGVFSRPHDYHSHENYIPLLVLHHPLPRLQHQFQSNEAVSPSQRFP